MQAVDIGACSFGEYVMSFIGPKNECRYTLDYATLYFVLKLSMGFKKKKLLQWTMNLANPCQF